MYGDLKVERYKKVQVHKSIGKKSVGTQKHRYIKAQVNKSIGTQKCRVIKAQSHINTELYSTK